MDRDEAFRKFQATVADVLEVGPDEVVPDARWEHDLGADSLAVVECTLALNEEFEIKIPDVDPEDLVTVGAAFAIVWRLLSDAA